MSIFRRNDPANPSTSPSGGPGDSSSPSSQSASQRRRVTHIAPGTRVEGTLSGATELLIDGEVAGEVRVQAPVTIGTDGVVQGPITANTVRVGGRVAGNVQATERVEVSPSGSLEGDIAAPRVVIAEGAFFKGRVEMRTDRGDGDKPDKQPDNKPEKADRPEKAPNESRRKGNGTAAQGGSAEAEK